MSAVSRRKSWGARTLAALALCAQLAAGLVPCESVVLPGRLASTDAVSLLPFCPCHVGERPAPTPSGQWHALLPAEPEAAPPSLLDPGSPLAGARAPWRALPAPEPVPLA
jgi:hypothetical protein